MSDQKDHPNFGHLSLRQAEIDGPIDLRYSRFATKPDFFRLKTSSYIDLEGAILEKGIKASSMEAPQGVDFYRATLGGGLDLEGSKIGDRLRIARCGTINGSLVLRGCEIGGELECYDMTVSGPAFLSGMLVEGDISIRNLSFSGDVQCFYTVSNRSMDISDCRFLDRVDCEGLRVAHDLIWDGAIFQQNAIFDKADMFGFIEGTAIFHGEASFTRTIFRSPTTIRACVRGVDLRETRFEAGTTLLLRYATVDMSGAVLAGPTNLVALSRPFQGLFNEPLEESAQLAGDPRVKLVDVNSVDTSSLTLTDIDLTHCRFAGAFNLDKLRLEGAWTFNNPPSKRIGLTPFIWTKRKIIEEERQWRALHRHSRPLRSGWGDPPSHEQDVPGLAALTTIYRQLRKGREDAKDEPGANDFYYGEMEMRRHSQEWRKAERWLLQAYWLLSGYGLRASRAFAWLGITMALTIILMMGFGLPQDPIKQEAIGTISDAGRRVTLEIEKQAPKNPSGARFTSKRLEKAINVTLNSAVFRSSGQDLTRAGTYIEMASRIVQPALLALGILAIRGRIKRGN
ncbi:pentapeptide repeat-containing protein [Nonomuraea polychroma]|uniref:pentapeptide repeat-containing protein n=1 Tax=Nonomuraea polychroma TaxID=46176 RepID=UPI000FDE85D1|nr:pentapeptide repeat-containing protein [Nonomuraea polychroma]